MPAKTYEAKDIVLTIGGKEIKGIDSLSEEESFIPPIVDPPSLKDAIKDRLFELPAATTAATEEVPWSKSTQPPDEIMKQMREAVEALTRRTPKAEPLDECPEVSFIKFPILLGKPQLLPVTWEEVPKDKEPEDYFCGVVVPFTVISTDTGKELDLTFTDRYPPRERTPSNIAEATYHACRKALEHELRESLFLHDRHFIDPHPENKHRPPPEPIEGRTLNIPFKFTFTL